MKLVYRIPLWFFFLCTYTLHAQLDLDFETDRGIYDSPFNLELTVNDPMATIRYTTDGTLPTPTIGTIYTSPIAISTTSFIRAIAYANTDTTKVLTHTYIFPNDIISKTYMSGHIVNNQTWGSQLEAALLSIPTASLVLPNPNNIDDDTRVDASVEFIFPEENIAVQTDTEAKYYGRASLNTDKKSIRVYFDSINGGDLEFPLLKGYEFGVPVTDKFDQIEFRSDVGESFIRDDNRIYVGPRFGDMTMLEMGTLTSHGRFIHLYINGEYRGQYYLRERMNDGFMRSYYGGNKSDYESINLAGGGNLGGTWNDGVPYDGTGDMWDALVATADDYAQWSQLINVNNYFDFMLIYMWGYHENEAKAVGNLTGDTKFLHRVNDGDYFFTRYNGVNIDRTNPNGTDAFNARGNHEMFQHLYNEGDPDFFIRFADRAHCHCFDDGALTLNKLNQRMNTIVEEMSLSIIAEAARWGEDSENETPDLWESNINDIENNFLPLRTDIVVNQLKNRGLYPNIEGVEFSQSAGEILAGTDISLTNPNTNGTIYYTTDGTDPRTSGGGVAATAQVYSGSISMPQGVTEIMARVKNGNDWSAACPKRFYKDIDYSNLVINEIMYHPDDTCSQFFDETDYIEIHNTGTTAIDLTDTKFNCGIQYKFDLGTAIAPGDFVVIAENIDTFSNKYGFIPDGQYDGGLSNDGERLIFENFRGNIIDSLTYNDKNPWDEDPDGEGPSLELLHPTLDNTDPINWFRSDNECGTPGAPNSRICASIGDAIVINEINYNSNNGITDPGDWVELYNPNPTPVNISDWTFYDNNNEFIFPSGTIIQPDDYLVLVEDDVMFSSIFPHLTANEFIGNFTFGLSNKGERVSLFNENKCLSDYVIYNDKIPWDTIPDGNGPSLSLIIPNSDNTLPQSWEASSNINSAYGTPGRANEPCLENIIEFPNLICAGFPAEIKIDSAYSDMDFTWFASGATPPSFAVDSDTLIWNNPGTYNIQLITKYFECTKVYTQSVTVEDCNTIPNIVDDNFAVNEDNVLSDNVLTNDNDPDNDNLTVNTSPQNNISNGTLTLNADGTFDYTPNPDFYGTDSFTYEVCDDATFGSATTTSGSFTGEVTSSADDVEELAIDGTIEVTSSDLDLVEDNPEVYSSIGIRMTNITVPQGATVTDAYLELVADEAQSGATSLTISAEATGNATAIPTTNYALSSKTKTSAAASWSNLPAWTTGNTYQSADISPVIQELINRGDWASGNAMTFIIEGTGRRTAESFDGTAAPKLVINYEVISSGGQVDVSLCDTAVVTINVSPENDAPQALDDNIITTEDNPSTGNVLTNDNDVDGDNLTANITPIIPPQNGSFFLLASGSYSYTPNVNFYGTDGFEYEICDDGSPFMCDTASVTIDITPINDTPIPAPDTLSMFANSSIQDNVLLNDIDIENNVLTASTAPIIAPPNGTVNIQPNGNIDYTSNPNFVGTDSFTYQVCDDGTPSLCNTETVTIIIEPDCVNIELAVWLEGAYNPTLGEMTNTLVGTRKLLPGQTPTSNLATPTPAGQPYNIAPWNYAGTEGAGWTDADYTGDETDWVLVSFRTDIQKNTEVGMTAALLMKDGSITFPDRCALTSTVASPLYIMVEHRNHIGVMTPQPVNLIASTLTYDFRLSDSYRDPTSFGQKQIPTGEWTMYAGDADQSDFPSFDIQGTDKTIWFDNNGIFDYYLSPDFNLDGDINGQDKSLWFDNNGISSRVPK